jgi:hypothetical protein
MWSDFHTRDSKLPFSGDSVNRENDFNVCIDKNDFRVLWDLVFATVLQKFLQFNIATLPWQRRFEPPR